MKLIDCDPLVFISATTIPPWFCKLFAVQKAFNIMIYNKCHKSYHLRSTGDTSMPGGIASSLRW